MDVRGGSPGHSSFGRGHLTFTLDHAGRGMASGYSSVGRGRGLLTCSTPGSPGLADGDRVTPFTPMRQDVLPLNFTESDIPVQLSSEQAKEISANISHCKSFEKYSVRFTYTSICRPFPRGWYFH